MDRWTEIELFVQVAEQGSLSRANGTRVYRYLPLGIDQAVRDYLREAILAGTETQFRIGSTNTLWEQYRVRIA